MTDPTPVPNPNAKAVSSAEPILARLEASTIQVFRVAAAELRKLLVDVDPFTESRVARIRYWVAEIELMPGEAAKAVAKNLRAWADALEPFAPTAPSVTAVPHTATAAPALIPFSITSTSITVSWQPVEEATAYRLDVSIHPDFESFVGIYHDLDVGVVAEHLVTGLVAATKYYVRVRAMSPTGASAYSDTIEVETPASSVT